MTATEAQGCAHRGWNCWERVAEALRELEAAASPDEQPEPAAETSEMLQGVRVELRAFSETP